MLKVSRTHNSKLKLTAILFGAILATGCISAKSKPTEAAAPAAPAVVAEEVVAVESVEVVEEEVTVEPKTWTVVAGDSLWSISSLEEVYNVPEQWPLIYKSNLDQIVDADLIYPGQVLAIPRAEQDEIDAAIEHARTRGAWEIGPVEATDKAYLLNN